MIVLLDISSNECGRVNIAKKAAATRAVDAFGQTCRQQDVDVFGQQLSLKN
jgi:hypothetical protein